MRACRRAMAGLALHRWGRACHMRRTVGERPRRDDWKENMRKNVIIGAIILLLAGGGYYQFSYLPAQEAAAKAAEEAAAAEAAAAAAAAEAEAAAAKAAEEAAAAEAAAAEVAADAAALEVATFDAVRVKAQIEASALVPETKAVLAKAVDAAATNPALVAVVLGQVKAALGK